MKRIILGSVITALVAVMTAPAAQASTPPTPVTVNCSLATGAFITQPGRYRLAKAVHDCGSTTLVDINGSGITLDLGGALLDGNDVDPLRCILANGSDITIRNGTVRDCQSGVVVGADHSTVSHVTAVSMVHTGIVIAGPHDVVKKSQVLSNGDDGLSGESTRGIITAVTATGNGRSGVAVVFPATVTESTARDNATGFSVRIAATLTDSIAEGNTGDGINVSRAAANSPVALRRNVADGNEGDGIHLATDGQAGDVIANNRADGNALQGIDLTSEPIPAGAGTNEASGNIGSPQCDGGLCG